MLVARRARADDGDRRHGARRVSGLAPVAATARRAAPHLDAAGDAGPVVTLQPLSAYQPGPYRPRRLAIGALLAVAAMYLVSVPLHWVGVVTATGSYRIVSGVERATWVVGVAAVVAAVALRLMRRPPGGYLRFLLLLLDFFVPLGMYIEYIDNVARASADGFPPYLGPGYFLALGATGVLIVASVFAWREPSD
jgi:hypothetical protein